MRLNLSPDLTLPADAVTQTFAILAMRGVGKTYTASVFAEELAKAALPFAVLDPTGAWYGLRSSADGKSDGYPVTILGGDHGDAPLEETGGKVIADLLAEEAPPLILDLSRLSKSAMRRFVADFAERLYEKNRNPLHLFIDEADAFVPQKPRPDEMRMLGAIDEIVRRGRIRGLGCTLVTQRSAVLNKDVLTQAEVLIVLRTAHPRDRAPVLEWMKVHATPEQMLDVEESLAKLPKGDAWVMSAGWLELFKRVHIRERRTFNSSATPEVGHRRIVPRKLAPVDLAALQRRMADTIAKAEAEDPKRLRAEIARLTKLANAKGRNVTAGAGSVTVKTVTIDRSVVTKQQIADLTRAAERITTAIAGLSTPLGHLMGTLNRWREDGAVVEKPGRRVMDGLLARRETSYGTDPLPASITGTRLDLLRQTTTTEERASLENGTKLKAGARRMLEQLAIWHPRALARPELAVLASVGVKGGTFSEYLSDLRTAGYIVAGVDSKITLTPVGLNAAGPVKVPHSTEEIVAIYNAKLKAGARRMLAILVAVHPGGVTRDELSESASVKREGGTFSEYLSDLRTCGLLREENGALHAAEVLFML